MLLKNFSILFIEDNEITQEQIKMILEDDVKEFYQAYDGKEGLDLYYEKKPDIIITDINIPFINGLELAAKIKKDENLKPVIIMSAQDDRDTILNSVNLGSNGFIAKPVDIDLLHERLHAIATILQEENIKKETTQTKMQELYKLAYVDPLTQIKNMLYFDKELTQLLQNSQKTASKFALYYINIDNLEEINKTHGYKAGDFILQNLAKNILKILPSQTLLARKSEDEFLLLYQDYLDENDLQKLAQTIIKTTAQAIQYESLEIKSSCSIGISQYPQDAKEKNELLFLAKNAMYNAEKANDQDYFFAANNGILLEKSYDQDIIKITPELFWHKTYHQLFTNENEIVLTKKELLFLSLLFSKSNYQASHEEITLHLWNDSHLDKKENIKTLVKTLRKKLPYNFLTNIFSIGYKIQFHPKV